MAERNPENNSIIQINSAALELRASNLCPYYSDSVFDLEISDNQCEERQRQSIFWAQEKYSWLKELQSTNFLLFYSNAWKGAFFV